MLAVTADRETARRASEAVDLGGGMSWRPLVLGPEGIPVITDVDRAVREADVFARDDA